MAVTRYEFPPPIGLYPVPGASLTPARYLQKPYTAMFADFKAYLKDEIRGRSVVAADQRQNYAATLGFEGRNPGVTLAAKHPYDPFYKSRGGPGPAPPGAWGFTISEPYTDLRWSIEGQRSGSGGMPLTIVEWVETFDGTQVYFFSLPSSGLEPAWILTDSDWQAMFIPPAPNPATKSFQIRFQIPTNTGQTLRLRDPKLGLRNAGMEEQLLSYPFDTFPWEPFGDAVIISDTLELPEPNTGSDSGAILKYPSL